MASIQLRTGLPVRGCLSIAPSAPRIGTLCGVLSRAAVVMGAIALLVALQGALKDARRAQAGCDTTYIYEGYADVTLPAPLAAAFPTYGLRRWVDRSPALQEDIAALRRRRAAAPAPAALLFVHGHLGSPQQMRSMASETVREAVRRARSGAEPPWVEWHAADFGAEPSAFEPRLLERQAAFVAGCMAHLEGTNAGGPLVLVGYSMGGLVVEAALRIVAGAGDAGAVDLRRVALVLTLGTPRHHLPTFLPPPRSLGRNNSCASGGGAASVPPAVHVLAGPGDLMIPGLSSWFTLRHRRSKGTTLAAPAVPAVRAALVQVDMDDVPGVWCTASHKAVVSCNQLVRRTVPLILDAAGGAGPAAVAAAAAARLTTAVLSGLPRTAAEALQGDATEGAAARGEGCEPGGGGILAWQGAAYSGPRCWRWTSDACGGVPSCSLFLLVTGMDPGTSLRVVAGGGLAGAGVNLAPRARPLPGMLSGFPSATPDVSKRPWHDVMAGVDWMGNATHVLRVPLGGGADGFSGAQVEVRGAAASPGAPPPTLLAQIVPLQGPSPALDVIKLPEILSGSAAPRLLSGHPAVVEFSVASPWRSRSAAAVLSALLIGPALPLRVFVASSPPCARSKVPEHAPVFLAAEPRSAGAGGAVTGDAVRRAAEGLPLWHPAVLGRQILLVSDPRCSYTLTVTWDLLSWVSYTLRYHAYAFLPLAFALSVAQLGGVQRSSCVTLGLCAALLAGLPALCVWPQLAEALAVGHPWLPLSTAEVGAIGCATAALVAALQAVVASARWAIQAAAVRLLAPLRSRKNAALYGGAAGVLVSSAIHPALPALAGTAALGAAAAAAPASVAPWAAAWLQTHFLGSAAPAAVWALGWAAAGSSCCYPALCLERAAAAAAGVHAWFAAMRALAGERPPGLNSGKGQQLACGALAGWTAAVGLWGRLHLVLLAAAVLSALDLACVTNNRQKWKLK